MSQKIKYADIAGPVFSHGGLKNWNLFLSEGLVIARPMGVWTSVKTGMYAAMGMKNAMNTLWTKTNVEGIVLIDSGDPGWRRYLLNDLEFIEVKKCHSANEIIIKLKGLKIHIYGIGDRSQTNKYRTLFRNMYPEAYRETGF